MDDRENLELGRNFPTTTQTEYQPTKFGDHEVSPSPSHTPEKVDVCVATAGGKIAPDRSPRRPVVEIRYTTIDTSYSQGRKKEVSERDTSLSKGSRPKQPAYSDFTLNKSISRDPTVNDYSYGSKTKREEDGHKSVILLAPFSLSDIMRAACIIGPHVFVLFTIQHP